MKNKSLRTVLYSYLMKYNTRWFNAGKLEELAVNNGNKGSTGSRQLRLLHEKGLIHRELRANKNTNKKSVWYSCQYEKTN